MNQQPYKGSPIGYFRVNDRLYEHRIFSRTDDSVQCLDEMHKVVLIYTANCEVKKPDGTVLGRWHLNSDDRTWTYKSVAGDVWEYGTDLLRAEMEVSKLYINK